MKLLMLLLNMQKLLLHMVNKDHLINNNLNLLHLTQYYKLKHKLLMNMNLQMLHILYINYRKNNIQSCMKVKHLLMNTLRIQQGK